MPRPRHPNKDLEKILRAAEAQGWRIERRKKYYMIKCPCPTRHRKMVQITPSTRDYAHHLIQELRRTCWEDS